MHLPGEPITRTDKRHNPSAYCGFRLTRRRIKLQKMFESCRLLREEFYTETDAAIKEIVVKVSVLVFSHLLHNIYSCSLTC